MAMNTTKTLERTGSVLGRKCEQTEKNMDKLMREALCAGAEMEEVMVPMEPGSRDDVIFAGLNGVGFYFWRGRKVKMPKPVAQMLRDAGALK